MPKGSTVRRLPSGKLMTIAVAPSEEVFRRTVAGRPVRLTVIVPCFNEEAVLRHTHDRLVRTLSDLNVEPEIIYVDDGSRDRTASLIRALCDEDVRVRAVLLSRNFGHQVAVTAGLDRCSGECAVIIDADLQDPPELIGAMVERWRDGYDVVYGKRETRDGESAFKLFTAHAFYRTLNALSEVAIPLDVGDFRLLDRRVVEALGAMRERDRFLRGMVAWSGFRQTPLSYQRERRFAGQTHYPLRKMIALALDGVLSFSVAPLRFVLQFGFWIIVVAVIGILYAIISRLFTDQWVSGWTLLFIAILFMGGVQIMVLGTLGEYVGRIYMQMKERPLYFVQDTIGFADGGRGGSGQE
jgi:dolichol-phosphate mannosyltransferase